MAINNLNESQSGQNSNGSISALAAELKDIEAKDEENRQKTAGLMEQIAIYEARLEPVRRARAEGESIAQGIIDMAMERVRAINENAHQIIRPQHEQIVSLEKQLIVLSQEVSSHETPEQNLAVSEPEAVNICPDPPLAEAEELNIEPVAQVEITPAPVARREFSLREPEESDSAAAAPTVTPTESPLPDLQPMGKREFSLREPQPLYRGEENSAPETVEDTEIQPPPPVKREYSLREPQ